MQKSQNLLSSIGKLVKSSRTSTMDQTQLGQRIGVGRNTISSIENGKPVNAETLFNALEHLGLIDDLQNTIDQKLEEQNNILLRKSRKTSPELDNDF